MPSIDNAIVLPGGAVFAYPLQWIILLGEVMNQTSFAPQVWRQRLEAVLDAPVVQRSLIALLLLNAVVLGLETSPALMANWGDWLRLTNQVILAVFVLEISSRLLLHRLAFFKDPWNVFDFVVVAIALVPASGPLAVLRALRVLRVLRLP